MQRQGKAKGTTANLSDHGNLLYMFMQTLCLLQAVCFACKEY